MRKGFNKKRFKCQSTCFESSQFKCLNRYYVTYSSLLLDNNGANYNYTKLRINDRVVDFGRRNIINFLLFTI